MSTLITIRSNFRPAESVSYRWYNNVARLLNRLQGGGDLKLLPGYNASAIQALMNVSGTIQWVTVEECD